VALRYYMDVHVPEAITVQLRRRGVDVLTVIEDDGREQADHELLERARGLDRVLFTMDIRFRVMAEDWQRQGREFAGLIFAHQQRGSIGQLVADLELIAKAGDSCDLANVVQYLPFETGQNLPSHPR
jgi:hypothetical protein